LVFPYLPPPPNAPENFNVLMRTFVIFLYLIPFGIAVWWLILFTRRSVIAQFAARQPQYSPLGEEYPELHPRAPLPVLIIAGLMLPAFISLLYMPFLPSTVPAIFFGHVFQGASAKIVAVLGAIPMIIAGVAILKLKRWGIDLAIALYALFLASGLLTLLN